MVLSDFLDSNKCKRVSTGEFIWASRNVACLHLLWHLTVAPCCLLLLCCCSHSLAAKCWHATEGIVWHKAKFRVGVGVGHHKKPYWQSNKVKRCLQWQFALGHLPKLQCEPVSNGLNTLIEIWDMCKSLQVSDNKENIGAYAMNFEWLGSICSLWRAVIYVTNLPSLHCTICIWLTWVLCFQTNAWFQV